MPLRLAAVCAAAACACAVGAPAAAAGVTPQKASPMKEKIFSRADLARLKTASRAEVFAALRSFDGEGLADDAFAWQALDLLDPGRVPGLSEARVAHDLPRALEAVMAVCRQQPSAEKPEADAATLRTADDALAHRFSFYGETHPLPETIDWQFNPGTAHWGHDLHRFSYLGPLTRAYQATEDVRYARQALDLILDWIAKCDFGRSFVIEKYAFGS